MEQISAVQKKILSAAIQCGDKRLDLRGLAETTGLKADKICEQMRNPEFRQLFSESMQAALTAETPAILKKFTDAAKEGSFKHGKLILELTGVYSEKQKVDFTGKVEFVSSPFKSDEERRAFLDATMKSLQGDE